LFVSFTIEKHIVSDCIAHYLEKEIKHSDAQIDRYQRVLGSQHESITDEKQRVEIEQQ
jgi:hypothetical protein